MPDTNKADPGFTLIKMSVCIECGGHAGHNLRACTGRFVDTMIPVPSKGADR